MKPIDRNRVSLMDSKASPGSRVTIVSHTHPDGDAIGSSLALREVLERRGCDVAAIYPEPVPETLAFIAEEVPDGRIMAFSECREAAEARIMSSDTVVCIDCNSFSRTGGAEKSLMESGAFKILIDHHLSPDTEAFGLVFSETEISSACELLYYILLELPEIQGNPKQIPSFAARVLMAGMTTDTNNFANSVYPTTFAMASGLLDAGVDRAGVLVNLYESYRENRLRLEGHLLGQNMRITPDGVAYMIVNKELAQEYDIREGETEGFVNMPLAIRRVKMSIFLKEDGEGFFRVSVRSKKGCSANRLATAYFHGGGHENASGGRLFFDDILGYKADIRTRDDAEPYILRVAAEFFESEGYEKD